MLRFRNASDPQLSARAKRQAQAQADESAPPVPRPPPEIITTAPTVEFGSMPRKPSRMFGILRRSGEETRPEPQQPPAQALPPKKDRRKSFLPGTYTTGKKSISIEDPRRPKSSNAPSSNGGHRPPGLPLPGTRLSESSRSEDSSDHLRGSTATSRHTVSNSNNFFRLPKRRPRQPEPLFPIAHLQKNRSHEHSTASSNPSLAPETPVRASTSSAASGNGSQQAPIARTSVSANGVTTPPESSPARALFQKPNASPATALFRPNSRNSATPSPTRSRMNLRERSSTMSSLGRESVDDRLAPPYSRASTSTGRKSFGDLLGISRLRNNPEAFRQGNGTPATPGSNTSKDNSLNIQRESVVLPERREDESPGKYLERLEEVASRSVIAAAISKNSDPFSLAVLRSYMRRFGFFGDPMDMAIRKLLMSAELPKETQHIDRFLQAFANRYHECNPGIYANPDQAYFIAFSLLILHTDVFNKNNKHKMQRPDYIKNTKGEGIFDEILEVFYDNITYTPFIHVEDDTDTNDRLAAHKAPRKKSVFPTPTPPDGALKKAAKEPIDPYTIILDNKLDILRPNLKEVMQLDDHFSYSGTAQSLNLKELQKTFFRTGILQIMSARSRPDAFMSEKTATNPQEAQPGVVDIKVTKVGLLWRKDLKKKKTRSPWQEWGAILTGAQLYFFRNTTWIKNLLHQYETHVKQGHDGVPIIFKPPLETFKPDALMSTDGAVALLDSSYKKHKHAFVYVRHGGLEEVLLADNEDEMNDWLAKLNYAAAFRTNGVRMRGVLGSSYDGQGRRAFRRLESEAEKVQTPTGEVTIARSKVDQQMAQDILFARREIMINKVAEANEKLEQEEKKLDQQLRNARHLQLLAPIQPKTRDQMLMSAARMAAQLKWTRVDIWKLKCHRDIMLLDLEEERQTLGLPAGPLSDAVSPEKPALGRELSKASSGTAVPSPLTLAPTNSHHSQLAAAESDAESAETETFETPPTSSTARSFHKHQNSWELPALNFDVSPRKASVSSAVSHPSIPSTPSRTATIPSTAAENPVIGADDPHEPDAHERELLEQAGLLGADITSSPGHIEPTRSTDHDAGLERHDSVAHSNSMDKADKKNIRRSLHRTLREGAGHLSHARSRKGKEPATTNGGAMDDNEAEMLTRRSGSFVVHGKKASVITFGSELHNLSPDERLRARKASQAENSIANGDAHEGSNVAVPCRSASTEGDFRAFLLSGPKRANDRRSSQASESTATARSFRDLHRKYSSAQAQKNSSGLAVPSDADSDAAFSFSEGRRSPLPTEHSATMDKARETMFFTPEPPASPPSAGGKNIAEHTEDDKEDRIPSPAIPVSA
ncbi:hypothetical protein VMCG_02806 [Cytospora schulzeri]|uniref:SEC7 domain-containing protein n=1 Tax=Cytospora schulzeri TaxID=448051 RepID=A0A423WZL2_9PEZI|nr:hypothetical protein VMCG_02806 [Valsa malicola]